MQTGPIPVSVLSGITDRLGVQYSTINNAIVAATAQGSGYAADRITNSDIFAVERDLLSPAYNLDTTLSGATIFPSWSAFTTYINAIGTHMSNINASTLSKFVVTSGIDLSYNFATLYKTIRSESLPSTNVFLETPVNMASIVKGVSSWNAPTIIQSIGTGSGSFAVGNLAAQPLSAVVTSSGIGASPVTFTLTGTNTIGTPTRTFIVPSTAVVGTTVTITSGIDTFYAVTNLTSSDTTATTNATVVVHSTPERTPTL